MPDEEKPEEKTSLEDLSRSYEAILDEQGWEVDGPEEPAVPPPEIPPPVLPESPPPPLRIIEALLFVGGDPLTPARAGEIIRGLTPAQFLEAVTQLNRDYRRQARPYAISPQGQGYVLTLRSRFRPIIHKIYGGIREARLSTATLDVLSLVAYRQPVTKQEIDNFRGAESGHLLRQLVRRGLVAILHRAESGQREVSYGTTQRFLDLFGLKNLEDLPRTQDLQQI